MGNGETRRQVEQIARQRRDDLTPEEQFNLLFDLVVAVDHDNFKDHEEIKVSLSNHCVDQNAHQSMRESDVRKVGGWVRDKLAAPIIVAVILIIINVVMLSAGAR